MFCASLMYTVLPPAPLQRSFVTMPSAAATTGVPRGARMSIAAWMWPLRFAVNESRNAARSTPVTGMIMDCGGHAAAPDDCGHAAGGTAWPAPFGGSGGTDAPRRGCEGMAVAVWRKRRHGRRTPCELADDRDSDQREKSWGRLA